MGGVLSSVRMWWFGSESRRIIMVGLDNAGKTTVLYKLKLGEVVTTIPTIGFNVESVQYRNISFTVWDLVGQKKVRVLWHYYFNDTHAVIFVIDSADCERFPEAREGIHTMLSQDLLRDAKLLVLANKQDMPGAATTATLTKELGLVELKGKEWYIQPTNAVTGEGLYEGLDWLHGVLSK